jgi:gas vesicle protein
MLSSGSVHPMLAKPKEWEEMPSRSFFLMATACLWLIAAPASADDKTQKAEAVRITQLVKQLGDDDFNEREKASAALDALGVHAFDALRQAVKSTDEEVRKRAETLVGKIEKRQETAIALKAKRVHLVYKDTAVTASCIRLTNPTH